MSFLFLFLTLSAFAASDTMDAFDKSYPRDNAFCQFGNNRIEILIHGESKFIEPKEKGFGELLFYRHPPKKPKLLKPAIFKADTFKFFYGKSNYCSKSHGHITNVNTLAILFLKENRPFKHKLAIQLFDTRTFTPAEFIETNYLTERAIPTKKGFAFNTYAENHNPDIGKVLIDGQEYIYQEKNFPQWMEYAENKFTHQPDLTFSHLAWRKFFKDQNDFLDVSGWDASVLKFKKAVVYYAINHKLKRKCLLFIEAKQKLAGTENWRCQTI